MIDIKSINGSEIIDFLNKCTKEESFVDTNIVQNSFVITDQELTNSKYILYFSVDYYNWGETLRMTGNSIFIDDSRISVSLDEPLDDDGTDSVIRDVLTEWIKNHKFKSNPENEFHQLVRDSIFSLSGAQFSNKKLMEGIINDLTKAKNLIK